MTISLHLLDWTIIRASEWMAVIFWRRKITYSHQLSSTLCQKRNSGALKRCLQLKYLRTGLTKHWLMPNTLTSHLWSWNPRIKSLWQGTALTVFCSQVKVSTVKMLTESTGLCLFTLSVFTNFWSSRCAMWAKRTLCNCWWIFGRLTACYWSIRVGQSTVYLYPRSLLKTRSINKS